MKGRIVYSAKQLFYRVGLFCLVIGGAVFGLMNRSALADQLHAWKVLPRPERLSELYYTDHAKLPKDFAPGDKQTVSFIVHNLEHQLTTYSYTLLARSGSDGKEARLGTGEFSLAHDTAQTINHVITMPDIGRRVAVFVQLEYDRPGESKPKTPSLHYWVNARGRRP